MEGIVAGLEPALFACFRSWERKQRTARLQDNIYREQSDNSTFVSTNFYASSHAVLIAAGYSLLPRKSRALNSLSQVPDCT